MRALREGFNASAGLRDYAQRAIEALTANAAAAAALESASAAVRDSLPVVFAASDFVAQSCGRDAQLLPQLLACRDLERRLSPSEFVARAPPSPPDLPASEAQMLAQLR